MVLNVSVIVWVDTKDATFCDSHLLLVSMHTDGPTLVASAYRFDKGPSDCSGSSFPPAFSLLVGADLLLFLEAVPGFN